MRKFLLSTATAISVAFLSSTSMADSPVYGGFPVTVKGYGGDETTSVSYSGQIARHVLHDSLKKLAAQGNGAPNPGLKAEMIAYFAGKAKDRAIIAPKTKGPFKIKQGNVDQISAGKNLAGKTYKGIVTGMPGNMTGVELLEFWIGKAASAQKGVDAANGYDYPQLISKFIIGAVFYNQAVDVYLDENLAADRKPNDRPYRDGAAYTGKEHVWDEAWGYFGAPAHVLDLSARQVYEIAKLGSASDHPEDALKLADNNGDGVVDLTSEMVFQPAYYAAGFDKGGKTDYLRIISQAFLDGRRLLAGAKGAALSDTQRTELRGYAAIIEENWEKVLAEAVFKYAGSVYKDLTKLKEGLDTGADIAKDTKTYIKHWGEMKGFSLALQTGRNNLGETAVRLNRMIGAGPLLPNLSQVVDIDSDGNYLRDQGTSIGDYMLHMLKVQKLMADTYRIKARDNDQLAGLDALSRELGDSNSAEND